MKITIQPGKYVVGVSGGVDSMVLLDLLRLYPRVGIIVAHYDHGVRSDSARDRKFVQEVAEKHDLPFAYDEGRLGAKVSEAEAREKRYAFLRKIQAASRSDGIITAHHQDDVLETAIINLMRGTGRKGLSSLRSMTGHDGTVARPLLRVPKSEILDYARRHKLEWHEDSTNIDTTYLRNHVRHNLLPKWKQLERRRLLDILERMQEVNEELDDMLEQTAQQASLDREWFIALPHNAAKEYLAAWLRRHDIRDFDRNTLERLTVAAKVAESGKAIDIVRGHRLEVDGRNLKLGRFAYRGKFQPDIRMARTSSTAL